jgi:hypothetical protein
MGIIDWLKRLYEEKVVQDPGLESDLDSLFSKSFSELVREREAVRKTLRKLVSTGWDYRVGRYKVRRRGERLTYGLFYTIEITRREDSDVIGIEIETDFRCRQIYSVKMYVRFEGKEEKQEPLAGYFF